MSHCGTRYVCSSQETYCAKLGTALRFACAQDSPGGGAIEIKLGFLGPILRVSDSVRLGWGLGICFAGWQLIFQMCLRQGPQAISTETLSWRLLYDFGEGHTWI